MIYFNMLLLARSHRTALTVSVFTNTTRFHFTAISEDRMPGLDNGVYQSYPSITPWKEKNKLMKVATFAAIADEFLERVNRIVWCNVATIDAKGRPRSRILHPLWQGEVGWITTRRGTPKEKHLQVHPFVSLAYIADVVKPVYADCKAEWIEDLAVKQHIWQLLQTTPPPLGFDPTPIYGSADHPEFGLLKLTPWRIEVTSVATVPPERKIWYASGIVE